MDHETKNCIKASFLLFSYNQENYIEHSVRSALEQSYKNLEIIISDDCSTDETFDIIKKITNEYNRPNVILNRNIKNIGTVKHVSKIIEMARGNFIIQAAGDDISIKNRAEFLVAEWEIVNRKNVAIFTNALIINEKNEEKSYFYKKREIIQNIKGFIDKGECWAGGFSLGYPKNLYEKFGPIVEDTFQEDGVIAFRAMLEDGIIYKDQTTVRYRRHSNNSYDPKNIKKLKLLNSSEIGLARQRLLDLEKSDRIDEKSYWAIKKFLQKEILKKTIYKKYPIILNMKYYYTIFKEVLKSKII